MPDSTHRPTCLAAPARPSRLGRVTPRLALKLTLTLTLTLALSAACASTSGEGPVWHGDPAVVAAAAPLLHEHSEALSGVRHLDAQCQRSERAADGSVRAVDDGRLLARRTPACTVLSVTAPKPRVVREDARARLVLDPLARGATRWTFGRNDRALLAVSALFLDLDALAAAFEIESSASAPLVDPRATRIVLVQRAQAEASPPVQRLELVLVPGQAVPRRITVCSRGGDQVEYRILRPALDPAWRDPEARLRVDVPAGYALEERAGT